MKVKPVLLVLGISTTMTVSTQVIASDPYGYTNGVPNPPPPHPGVDVQDYSWLGTDAAQSPTPSVTAKDGGAQSSENQLSTLETRFFETTYPRETAAQRLERLEKLVFGEVRTGADDQRLKNLVSAATVRKKSSTGAGANQGGSSPVKDGSSPVTLTPSAPVVISPAAVPTVVSTPLPLPAADMSTQTSGSAVTGAPAKSETPAATGAVAPQADPQAQLNDIFKSIATLVKKFYSKANVTISNSTMHFDEKCKNETDFYSDRMVLAPASGGILCDITLKSGEYKGEDKNRLPSEVADGFHTNLTMAPYSKQQNKYLLTRLSFPPDIDVGFKKRFKTLVGSFNGGEQLAAKAGPTKSEAEAPGKAGSEQPSSGNPYDDAANLMTKGDLKGAVNLLNQVINNNKNDWQAFLKRGQSLYQLGVFDVAQQDFNQVIKLKPTSADGFFWRANTFSKLSDSAKAAQDYSQVLNLEPNYIADHSLTPFNSTRRPPKAKAKAGSAAQTTSNASPADPSAPAAVPNAPPSFSGGVR